MGFIVGCLGDGVKGFIPFYFLHEGSKGGSFFAIILTYCFVNLSWLKRSFLAAFPVVGPHASY